MRTVPIVAALSAVALFAACGEEESTSPPTCVAPDMEITTYYWEGGDWVRHAAWDASFLGSDVRIWIDVANWRWSYSAFWVELDRLWRPEHLGRFGRRLRGRRDKPDMGRYGGKLSVRPGGLCLRGRRSADRRYRRGTGPGVRRIPTRGTHVAGLRGARGIRRAGRLRRQPRLPRDRGNESDVDVDRREPPLPGTIDSRRAIRLERG